jgi:hypothetical protein
MKNITSVSIGLATLALTTGYALQALWIWTIIIVALGLFWLLGQRRGWSSVTGLAFILFIGTAAFGIWQDVSAGWMLFGLIATLVAWDLVLFTRRLAQAGQVEAEAALARVHLQRLLLIASLGLLLGSVALRFQFELNLGWSIFLGILAIAGLSQVIGFLRRESA